MDPDRSPFVPVLITIGVLTVGGLAIIATQTLSGDLPLNEMLVGSVGSDQAAGCGSSDLAHLEEQARDDIAIDMNNIPEAISPTDGPGDASVEQIPGQFVVKFSEAAADAAAESDRLVTGVPSLDATLDDARVTGARRTFVERTVPERSLAISTHLGLDRVWEFESDLSYDEVIEILEADDAIEWVEPLIAVRAFGTPNDVYYPYQWHMSAIGLPAAHDITDGSGVTVAVVDSGVSSGSDGYGDLLTGYDVVDDDSDASDSDYNRSGSGSHGTHVAGTIAQTTNNGTGVAGLAPGASILPVRVLAFDRASGGIVGSSADVADGIIWAVDNGADVINLSLGSSSYSAVIANACDYAYASGVVVVAAAGNDGYTSFISYPGALSSTIAVGATDLNHTISYYSNQGSELTLVAPGGDTTADQDGDGYADGVLQETRTSSGWSYSFFQGTSMASPHVAAVAALVIANGVTDVADVWDALTETADDLGASGWDSVYGHGLVNPLAALDWTADAGGDPAIEISALRSRRRGPRRVLITFKTDVAGDTLVEGSDGSEYYSDSPVTAHSASMRGRPGDTITYTVTSESAAGAVASDTITVTF